MSLPTKAVLDPDKCESVQNPVMTVIKTLL